ncbi:VWA domain-containing protein [bacterium]|nr:VWA domain-containing protein [bacterium]
MRPADHHFPFTAVVGQDRLKHALVLTAVCPALGGVLAAGDRGTAKTTTARGLAALLPRLAVVRGCPFRCDPAAVWPDCPHCRDAAGLAAEEIDAPFVELPLGATEDRVAGSLDLERTLRDGRPAFRPGLLAAAHRGVLYIDEVNLLADHLVDLLLDAAAAGMHVVEREGVAVRHPARFVLVGSMNPAEGELRPQLADRFGLRVDVRTPTDPAGRAEVIRRRLAFDADPAGFRAAWAAEEGKLGREVAAARAALAAVRLTDEQLTAVAAVCCEHHVEGLRADLALGRAARAGAALAGRTHVTNDDLRAAADLVLAHRTRRPPPGGSRPEPPREREDSPPPPPSGGAGERLDPPGPVVPLTLARSPTAAAAEPDRGRSAPLPAAPRGRTVRTVPAEVGDGPVALDATLRAAALRGSATVGPEDLHRRVREDRRGSLVVFVVDASGSMGARRRMEAVKGVALGLLGDAGRARDEVAVVSVRGPRAELLLAPTRDAAAADRALARLPTGGRTPLAHGLQLAADLAHDRTGPVLVVVVSDGRANVSLPGSDADPWAQAVDACAALALPHVTAKVIDAEAGVEAGGRAAELAAALGAECLPLAALGATLTGEMK